MGRLAKTFFISAFLLVAFLPCSHAHKEHKMEMAFAAAGCIPVFLEAKKFQSIYVAEKETVEAERSLKVAGYLGEESKWARDALPALKPTYAAEFYEFKQDVTVYYGKVKDGTAWQVFVPEDVPTNEVLKWTGIEAKLKR